MNTAWLEDAECMCQTTCRWLGLFILFQKLFLPQSALVNKHVHCSMCEALLSCWGNAWGSPLDIFTEETVRYFVSQNVMLQLCINLLLIIWSDLFGYYITVNKRNYFTPLRNTTRRTSCNSSIVIDRDAGRNWYHNLLNVVKYETKGMK